MARKKSTKTAQETKPAAPGNTPVQLGVCAKCRHFEANNMLKGYWEGFCKKGNGLVTEHQYCQMWQARNG